MPKPDPATKNIVIVGGLLVDDIAISTENLRPSCSNPVSWHHRLGGVATNVARVAAQQVGVLLIACTGDDEYGKRLAGLLAQHSLSSSLVIRSGESSDRYTAVLDSDGELFIGLADASLVERMRWSDIEQRLPEWRPEAIVIDANLSQICISESISALASHYESPVPVYALAVSPAKSVRMLHVAEKVDVLLCNRREAAALTNLDWQEDINRLADGLLEQQFSSFVITDGGDPILVQEMVQDRQSRSFVPVPEITIDKNVNGAGDALAGATIVQLINGQSLPQAVSCAGLEAARAVLFGSTESPPV